MRSHIVDLVGLKLHSPCLPHLWQFSCWLLAIKVSRTVTGVILKLLAGLCKQCYKLHLGPQLHWEPSLAHIFHMSTGVWTTFRWGQEQDMIFSWVFQIIDSFPCVLFSLRVPILSCWWCPLQPSPLSGRLFLIPELGIQSVFKRTAWVLSWMLRAALLGLITSVLVSEMVLMKAHVIHEI